VCPFGPGVDEQGIRTDHPMVAVYYLITEGGIRSSKKQLTGLVLILAAYCLVRFVIFGSNAATYTESGYLLGMNYYQI
jgi:hypothetical protein